MVPLLPFFFFFDNPKKLKPCYYFITLYWITQLISLNDINRLLMKGNESIYILYIILTSIIKVLLTDYFRKILILLS